MGGIFVPWLADAARTTGYPVVEVAGWHTRGHGGFAGLEGIVGHHTGTAQTAAGDYPSLRIVRDGRSDLPGPLCNYGLGRNGTIYVVAAGVAWHAGVSAYAGFSNLNDKFLGVEAEHAGGILPWTPAQLDCYPKLIGAALRYMSRPATRYCSHRTCALPAGRKPDPKSLDDAWMIRQAAAFMSGRPAAPGSAIAAPAPYSETEDEPVKVDIDPTTGEFKEVFSAEAGNGSVYTAGWATFCPCWGDVDMMITALLADGTPKPLTEGKRLRFKNNTPGVRDLPAGTRAVTVEGRHLNPADGRLHATFIGRR